MIADCISMFFTHLNQYFTQIIFSELSGTSMVYTGHV